MIVCRSRAEIDKLRRVNQLVGEVLGELRRMAVPGVTTADIDQVAEERVRAAGADRLRIGERASGARDPVEASTRPRRHPLH
jgi:methionine aminopeptidase